MDWLIVRADADSQVGAGHIMRALALAQRWLALGGRVRFVSTCESLALVERVLAAGAEFAPLGPAPTAEAQVRRVRELSGDWTGAAFRPWVLLDSYAFHLEHQRAFRAAGYHVLCMDDLAHEPRYAADLVVNQNPGAEDLSYAPEDFHTEFLLGSRYILLRSEFIHGGIPRSPASRVTNLLITFGGADPDHLTERAIHACAGIPGIEVRVVIGAVNPHEASVRAAMEEASVRGEVFLSVTDMAQQMAWAHLAVSAAGQTCWEMAHCGLPALVVPVADNQRRVADSAARLGTAVNLGAIGTATEARMREALQSLIDDPNKRASLTQRGQALVDGQGARRVVDCMRLRQIAFRPAAPEDCRWVWALSNDPAVRAASFHDAPIPLETHERWFTGKLADPHTVFWIAQTEGGEAVAQIRFEERDDVASMSISLVPEYRQRGLGRLLIQKACDVYQHHTPRRILALVREKNTVSIQAFLRAGFTRQGTCSVHGHSGVVFQTPDGETQAR